MTMTTATTSTVWAIKSIDETGCILTNGDRLQAISWENLKNAATQKDKQLAAVYSEILAQARKMAEMMRQIRIVINNRTNTPHGNEAELRNLMGEFVSGRLVGVDFGENGTYAQALRDAERAKEILTGKGYTVTIDAR